MKWGFTGEKQNHELFVDKRAEHRIAKEQIVYGIYLIIILIRLNYVHWYHGP